LFFDPLVGAQITEFAVGAVLVIIETEVFNDHPCLTQIEQEFPVEAGAILLV
jgi:hypothetical protein